MYFGRECGCVRVCVNAVVVSNGVLFFCNSFGGMNDEKSFGIFDNSVGR